MSHGIYSAVLLGPDHNPKNGILLLSLPALDNGDVPPEVDRLWQPGKVAICWSYPHEAKPLSPSALASVRRKRLDRRLQRDVPLFEAEYRERELATRQAFYQGERQ